MKLSDINGGNDTMDEIKEEKVTPEEIIKEEVKTPKEVEKVQEDCFQTLYKDKDKEIKVLNIYTGCIVNTYFKNNVASIYVPGNHLRNGEIQSM